MWTTGDSQGSHVCGDRRWFVPVLHAGCSGVHQSIDAVWEWWLSCIDSGAILPTPVQNVCSVDLSRHIVAHRLATRRTVFAIPAVDGGVVDAVSASNCDESTACVAESAVFYPVLIFDRLPYTQAPKSTPWL